HEDARQRSLVGGIEAQLNALVAEIGAHFEEAALPPHSAVLSDEALLAMEEDLVKVDSPGDRPELIDLCEHVLARGAARGVLDTRVVFGPEPGPVFGVELRERKGLVRQLVADLLAPCPVPSLDDSLGLGVLHAGVEEVNPEVGADVPERPGDV